MDNISNIERTLVGYLFHHPAVIPIVQAKLPPEDFAHYPAAVVVRAIYDAFKEYNHVDVPLVEHLIVTRANTDYTTIGGRKAIEAIAACGSQFIDLDAYVAVLHNAALLRRIAYAAEEIRTSAQSDDAIATEVLDHARRRLDDLLRQQHINNGVHLPDYIDPFLQSLGTSPPGLKTGYHAIDQIIGAIHPGDLVIIAGRPGMGKTALLIAIMAHLARKHHRCAFISLEMRTQQIVTRICCALADLHLARLLNAVPLTQAEYQQLQQSIEVMRESQVWIYDDKISRMHDIYQVLLAQHYRYGLDAVFVDYLQLIGGERKRYESRQHEITEISRSLKLLAHTLNVPLLVGSQLSRQVEMRADKRPTLSDLRESGSIEQDADIVMFLHRPDPNLPNLSNIIVAKHRNGPTGIAQLAFVPHRATFIDFDENV